MGKYLASKYRPDIDGLRAIAVMAVVGFHAFPEFIKSGFIGVDVFFVISGYLITKILLDDLCGNSFSLIEFYSRRMLRIFPSLVTVLLITYVIGWFTLLPMEYKELGKHLIGGATFISNLIYWRESGYFDTASEHKPLLHLWSLGVEEQFYILWPIILLLGWRLKKSILSVVVIIFILSFCFNIAIYSENPVALFYSPQSRFWELLIGALIVLVPHQLSPLEKDNSSIYVNVAIRVRKYFAHLGFFLLVSALFLIDKKNLFPSWWGLLPTIGAALIILSNKESDINRYLLSNRFLVWIGNVSYPLYLWHWPLLSYAVLISGGALSWETRLLLVILAIFLAWLTYYYVEKPIRYGYDFQYKKSFLIIFMLLIVACGVITYKNSGWPSRFHAEVAKVASSDTGLQVNNYLSEISVPEVNAIFSDKLEFLPSGDFVEKLINYETSLPVGNSCVSQLIGKSTLWTCGIFVDIKKPTILLVGDSMAQSLYPGYLNVYGNSHNIKLIFASGCPPISDFIRLDIPDCANLNALYMEMIKLKKPEILVLSGFWSHQFPLDKVRKFIIAARENTDGGVYVIGEAPRWSDKLNKLIYYKYKQTGKIPVQMSEGLLDPLFSFDNELRSHVKDIAGVDFLSVGDVLCKDGLCTVMTGYTIESIVQIDSHHYSPSGAAHIVSRLHKKL